jgi:hypothetical protein
MDTEIKIDLTSDQALVLFDFLDRLKSTDNSAIFADQAEQRVLWDIEAMLEKVLVDSLKSNYPDLLKASRDKIRDKN